MRPSATPISRSPELSPSSPSVHRSVGDLTITWAVQSLGPRGLGQQGLVLHPLCCCCCTSPSTNMLRLLNTQQKEKTTLTVMLEVCRSRMMLLTASKECSLNLFDVFFDPFTLNDVATCPMSEGAPISPSQMSE